MQPDFPVLFPCGVTGMPRADVEESKQIYQLLLRTCTSDRFQESELIHSPLIMFPRLQGWYCSRPTGTACGGYLAQLRSAIDVLNTANVAHLDLRAANVMWRTNEHGAVHIKVIDFEDAVAFGHVIPEAYVKTIVDSSDFRYRFRVGDETERQFASQLHNEFYFRAFTSWLESSFPEFDMDTGRAYWKACCPTQICKPTLVERRCWSHPIGRCGWRSICGSGKENRV